MMVYLLKKEKLMYNKKEADRKYYLKHREKAIAKGKEYYESHKKVKEYPDLEGDEWLPLVGYEGYYMASNLGRIKSLWEAVGHIPGRVIGGCLDKDGYIKMTLTNPDRTQSTYRRARLIANTWIPNPDNKPEIDHINTIRTDDRVENLRWVSSSENKQNEQTKANRSKVDYGFNRGKHLINGRMQ
jgi:hypothetical protein